MKHSKKEKISCQGFFFNISVILSVKYAAMSCKKVVKNIVGVHMLFNISGNNFGKFVKYNL